MGRILLNTLTAISLLLALGTAGLWVRSYSHWSFLRLPPKSLPIMLYSGEGGLFVRVGRTNDDGPTVVEVPVVATAGVPSRASGAILRRAQLQQHQHEYLRYGFGGFRYDAFGAPGDNRMRIPHGAAVGLPSAFPIAVNFQQRRRSRARVSGHCPVCGYDMRANPERCSECGHGPVALKPS